MAVIARPRQSPACSPSQSYVAAPTMATTSESSFHPRANSSTAAIRTAKFSTERARSFSQGSVSESSFHPRANSRTAARRTTEISSEWARSLSNGSVSGSSLHTRWNASPKESASRTSS